MIYNGIIKGIGEDGEEVTIKINDVIIRKRFQKREIYYGKRLHCML